ncbi:MAG: hypothetical protein ACKO26_25880, partial [Planctomycetota bacterium]
MKGIRACVLWAVLVVPWMACPALAEDTKAADRTVSLKNSTRYLSAFQKVVSDAAKATVSVMCEGKVVCLGTVVKPDGHILTKA